MSGGGTNGVVKSKTGNNTNLLTHKEYLSLEQLKMMREVLVEHIEKKRKAEEEPLMHSTTGLSIDDRIGLDGSERFEEEGEQTVFQKKMAALKLQREQEAQENNTAFSAAQLALLEQDDLANLEHLQGALVHRDTLANPNNAKKYEFADTSSDDDDGELTERSERTKFKGGEERMCKCGKPLTKTHRCEYGAGTEAEDVDLKQLRSTQAMGGVLNMDQMVSVKKGAQEVRKREAELEMANLEMKRQ